MRHVEKAVEEGLDKEFFLQLALRQCEELGRMRTKAVAAGTGFGKGCEYHAHGDGELCYKDMFIGDEDDGAEGSGEEGTNEGMEEQIERSAEEELEEGDENGSWKW